MEDIKKRILDNIIIKVKHPTQPGGQSVHSFIRAITVKSEELDVEITIGYYRSQIQNKELALTLFNLAVDDILR